jgi:glycosyltransferase involved in cell wall biosynthesis
MKKILWLCNSSFSDNLIKGNGSWLQPMAENIQAEDNLQLYNITIGNVDKIEKNNYKNIVQWILPNNKTNKFNQIASIQTCKEVTSIIEQVQPDLIHIWGTESVWASIYRQGYIKYKTMIDIQGLLFVYTEYYYGGLTNREIIQSIHLKEILMPRRTLFNKKRTLRKRGNEEVSCLKTIKNISFQSVWVKNQVSIINPDAQYFATRIMLRAGFYTSPQWKYKAITNSPVIFSSSSAAVSYKGLHVLIKAIVLLKRKYPDIQLRLAGTIDVGNRLLDGYSKFLRTLIAKTGLENSVVYTGSLNENQMIGELLNCNVCVVPSFIETYCLAFAEAMMVGVPVVVSYAGAMPELGEHNKEAMFYNSLDHVTCAAYIDQLIQNRHHAELLSSNARIRRFKENDKNLVVATQVSIYNSIIDGNMDAL